MPQIKVDVDEQTYEALVALRVRLGMKNAAVLAIVLPQAVDARGLPPLTGEERNLLRPRQRVARAEWSDADSEELWAAVEILSRGNVQ